MSVAPVGAALDRAFQQSWVWNRPAAADTSLMGYRVHTFTSLAARRALAAFVVASLLVPIAALAQTSDVLYLDAAGVPKAGFSASPPGGTLDNFDPARDPNPGLFLEPTSGGAGETDPIRYQMWWTTHNAIDLDGEVKLVLSAASAGTESDTGKLNAYLLDCSGNLRDCTVVDSRSVTRQAWGTGWRTVTFEFGSVDHQLANGRKLAVKVTVDAGSSAGMHLAYAAGSHPSRLVVSQAAPTTTTAATTTTTQPATTTTTSPPTSTTTTAATTTTTQPTTTTTVPTTPTTAAAGTAPATTTTTMPGVETVPPTTLAVGYPGGGGALPPTSGAATGAQPETGAPTTTVPVTIPTPADAVTPNPDDADSSLIESLEGMPDSPALRSAEDILAMVVESPQPSVNVEAIIVDRESDPVPSEPMGRAAVANVVEAVELVLPAGAARVAVSPLVVADALVELLVRTGQGLSVPAAAAGVVVGMLVIGVDRRAAPKELL
jgi:hypothetical protein